MGQYGQLNGEEGILTTEGAFSQIDLSVAMVANRETLHCSMSEW